MKMMKNKKGFFPGWEYIAGFFLVSIIFIFSIGMYDFTLEEIYNPVHQKLNDTFVTQGINSGESYDAFVDNYDTTHNRNLPFNLLYIFMFANAIVLSIINVSKSKKLDPMELIFKTIGGLIFFIYLMQLTIFKVITYFKIQIVDYLFTDLIVNYVPFYLVTFENAGEIILIWGGVLILLNWYFGKTEQEFKGVFGQ